jgi:hypothetical protein
VVAEPSVVLNRNYFALLHAMETVKGIPTGEGAESQTHTQQWKPTTKGTERLPPIILTAMVNLLEFHLEIKAITNGSFEF